MNEDEPIPYSVVIPCEAELIFMNTSGHGRKEGDKCSMPSCIPFNGKWVCWCHWHALTSGPRVGDGKVEYTILMPTKGIKQYTREMPVDFWDPRWSDRSA